MQRGRWTPPGSASGDAAGTKGVGLNRVRVAPGRLPTPPHSHGASEEVYYVLAGSGLHWQDDEVDQARPGDCIIHRAERDGAHVRGRPRRTRLPRFSAPGTRRTGGWLPRSSAVRFAWPWVEGRIDDPWDREAEGPPLAYGEPAERPPNILNIDEVEHLSRTDARRRRRSPRGSAPTWRASTGSISIPAGEARCPTATRRRRRSSSSSRARGRSTSGRRPRSRRVPPGPRGGDSDPRRPHRRPAARNARQPLVPGRRERG